MLMISVELCIHSFSYFFNAKAAKYTKTSSLNYMHVFVYFELLTKLAQNRLLLLLYLQFYYKAEFQYRPKIMIKQKIEPK